MKNETEPITRPLSEKELKKLKNEEFDQYCSKIIKKLSKSVADDLDFYDYPKTIQKFKDEESYLKNFENDLTRGGTLNEVN